MHGFAVELLRERKAIEDCPPLVEEPKYKEKLEGLGELLAPILSIETSKTGMVIHEERCFGCGNCVVVCPMNAASDPKGTAIGRGPVSGKAILMVEDGMVKGVNVDHAGGLTLRGSSATPVS